MQDEIAETIAGTVEPELSAIEGAALRDRAAEELTAWECFQSGLRHLYRFKVEDLNSAKWFFERAIELDKTLAPAYARLAYVHIQLGFYGPRKERSARLEDAIRFSRTALNLDDRDPAARVSLGRAFALQGHTDQAISELRTAVELDRSFAQAHFALGQALCYQDRADEALIELNESIRLSPRDPHLWTFLNLRAIAHYIAGNYDLAEADERAALRQPNATFWPMMMLVAILGRKGKTEVVNNVIADLQRLRPDLTCAEAYREHVFTDRPFMTERFLTQLCTDLRAAGLPE